MIVFTVKRIYKKLPDAILSPAFFCFLHCQSLNLENIDKSMLLNDLETFQNNSVNDYMTCLSFAKRRIIQTLSHIAMHNYTIIY